jgi:hypothetical protein
MKIQLQRAAGACPTALLFMLVLFVGLGLPGAGAQSDPGERAAIEIVTINYRDPTQIRQQIASTLDSRGSIGQIDNKLVIASTAANLARLKEMIERADTPPRRLVVSVDFEHDVSNPLFNSSRQQSAQAIEGDELLVVDNAASGQIVADQNQLGILLVAEVRGQMAIVSFQLNNVSGLMGRHTVEIPLGAWYVINPTEENGLPEDNLDSQDADLLSETGRPMALRVDVLP